MLADHQRDELTTQAAVAVLATERAAVFFDQMGDIRGHSAEHVQSLRCLEIKQRPGVQLARTSVGVVDAFDGVFVAQ